MFILVSNNKETLLEEITNLNTKCYMHKLSFLSDQNRIASLLDSNKTVHENLFCKNVKEYLSTLYGTIMKVLTMLREDNKIFERFIEEIESIPDSKNRIPEYEKSLDYLAEDLVFLLFSDFSSSEKNIAILLRQFKVMITKVIKSYTIGKNIILFENPDLMVNRMIKAFLNSNDNRDYLQLLFGKLFDEAADLKKYAQRMKCKKDTTFRRQSVETLSVKKTEFSNSFDECRSKIMEEHFGSSLTIGGIMSGIVSTEESKFILREMETSESKIDNILLICDGIIHRIIKKLLYMPLPMRYLCKLLEKIAKEEVLYVNNRVKPV